MSFSLPPLSVLDLSTVGSGHSTADALAATTAGAQKAEQLGYRRYWVAEHHNFPAVASTSPPVLIAHIAASTSTISVGSGGVMLPNHAPLVVAEQFAMLEALHPGRIDLGLGRAPGTDQRTAAALRRGMHEGPDDFPKHVIDLMGLLGMPKHAGTGLSEHFICTPAQGSFPNIFLLGSSNFSAQLAGMLGLPFSFAHHFAAANAMSAVEHYRAAFRPSEVLDEPYVLLATAALAADTAENASRYSLPGKLMTLDIWRNNMGPVRSVEDAERHVDRKLAEQMGADRIAGDAESVMRDLEKLAQEFEADELMITTVTHGLDERLRSMELIAHSWDRQSVG